MVVLQSFVDILQNIYRFTCHVGDIEDLVHLDDMFITFFNLEARFLCLKKKQLRSPFPNFQIRQPKTQKLLVFNTIKSQNL